MIDKYIPRNKVVEVIADADIDTSSEFKAYKYLAFPSIVPLNESELLICYRRGERHAWSNGVIETIRWDREKNKVLHRKVLDVPEKGHDQNVEAVKMPNGDIVCYVDNQAIEAKTRRLGMKQMRSKDNGHTWERSYGLVDDIGIEYGYVYDSLQVNDDIYLIALTYLELEHQGMGRTVQVIRSSDNGQTWVHVKNLAEAFGYSCDDECSFVRCGDGFMVVSRGRDNITRMFLTDSHFNMIKGSALTEEGSLIQHVGRPKLFVEDEKYYLLTRNIPNVGQKKQPFELLLTRIDPEKLKPVSAVLLDVCDSYTGNGYYAEYYLQDGERFNVITYSDNFSENPDILRLEYDWKEVNMSGKAESE